MEQLGAADATCPVCLRPIDEDIAEHAAAGHRARLAELDERQAAADRRQQEVAFAAEKTRAIAAALASLRPPHPPRAPRPEPTEADVVTQRAELDDAVEQQTRKKGALEEQLRQAERTLDEADGSEAAIAELARLHAVAAAASSLEQLATAEADARTETSLGPISRTLADRWAEFFITSPATPRLSGVGQIELERGAVAAIPYPSFSGGEKTLASLLTRLLFVTAATQLHTMWLDEPLEHLDPTNRTRVARLLAQVTRPGAHMRQVVVTTYEEGLARSMTKRYDPTNIVYVSTDELL
jgi:DNA repair exonuclease SbcCD ATPase subunit